MISSLLVRSKKKCIFNIILPISYHFQINGLLIRNLSNSTNLQKEKKHKAKYRWLKKIGIHPQQLIPKEHETFNRWCLIPAAILNHICIGSVYAWSIFNEPLTRLDGVIAPAANDWSLVDISLTYSLIMGGFAWGAILGKYLDRFGPTASCLLGSFFLGSGFCIGAVAIQNHNLYLLYVGGGVWGLANGWAYVPPISTLIKWFPERKGFASGAGIMGFAAGALVATPIFTKLLSIFRQAPEYIGSSNSVNFINESGRIYTQVGDDLREVVIATAADAKAFGLTEGVYLVGTGSTGAAETFLILGIGYSFLMATTSFVYRLPPPIELDSTEINSNINADAATRSPQFWLLWTGFGLYAAGAQAFIGSACTIMKETFMIMLPDISTESIGTSFVILLSTYNLTGRIMWASISDLFAKWKSHDPFYGRKFTFTLMWGMATPCYLLVVWSIHKCAENPGIFPLTVFCASVGGIIIAYGGASGTRPAITGDLFGASNVSVLTARQLTVLLFSSYFGPKLFTSLRENAMIDAMIDLTQYITDSRFQEAFGCGKDQLDLLILNKTVTINRLMELVPEGTIDPTPFLYDRPMYALAGLSACAWFTNEMLYPLQSKRVLKKPTSTFVDYYPRKINRNSQKIQKPRVKNIQKIKNRN